VHIAYEVLGDGPTELVYVGAWATHLEYRWELPQYASFLRRPASFSRLILFDKRGFGLSDPVSADQLPDLETRMDDIRAVLDEVGSERAVIYGASESGMLDLLFAATYPDRSLALVIHGSYPSARWEPGAKWGMREDEHAAWIEDVERNWGTEDYVRRIFPSTADDPPLLRWGSPRTCAAPRAPGARSWWSMEYETVPASTTTLTVTNLWITYSGPQARRRVRGRPEGPARTTSGRREHATLPAAPPLPKESRSTGSLMVDAHTLLG
jgi:pimeloyl-ACP methyl ester carboxylesterase